MAPPPPPAPPGPRPRAHRAPDAAQARKVALASAVGATIEWYDFFLYGTAAGLVFDQLFFNGLSGPAAQFAAFGTFAVGLRRPAHRRADLRPLRRPDRPQDDADLDAGDHGRRHGRDRPAADVRRRSASGRPILLVVLRILQGIGVGGEYGGAVLLAVEFAPAERRGFFGSFAHIGVPGGLFLASGAFAIASQLPDEAFLAWGWRACFLLSIVLLAIGAWIRLSVMETPAFQVVAEEKEISAMPVTELFRRQPRRLLLGMGTRFIEGFTFNLFSVYLLAYAVKNVGVPRSTALNAIMVGARSASVLVVVAGHVSDRVGRKRVFSTGATSRCSSPSRPPGWCSTARRCRSRRRSSAASASSTASSTARWRPSGPSSSTPATATRRCPRSTRSPASSPPG